ncbi:MAG: hypothetical protein ACT4OF_00005 [Caulobacteraceae bacterium]
MTDTVRRALLGAIALAPVVGATSAVAAAPLTELSALDTDALLRYGATLSADGAFADLCAAALTARARSDAAAQVADAAYDAAEADTPPFPSDLCFRERYCDPDTGETTIYERRWTEEPRNVGVLWNLAHWLKDKAGISYVEAEAQLRASHIAWCGAWRVTNERHNTDALTEASIEAGCVACHALDAVISHPARCVSVLLVQFHLRRAECLLPSEETEWAALVSHVERALN